VGERIERLRKRYLEAKPRLCTERARIATEVYRRTEGEPPVLRAAKVLEAVLRGIRVWILDEEFLVGHWASTLRGVPMWPEYGLDEFENYVRSGFELDEATEREVRELSQAWEGKNYHDRVRALLPERINAAREASLWYWHMGVPGSRRGRYLVNLPLILSRGFAGVEGEARERLERIDPEEPEALRRQLFYRAVITVCRAVGAFAGRYAREAREGRERAEGRRREELEEMARICERVPALPAGTFREALQSTWFTFLVANLESGGDSISFGRLDQILCPYYQRDLERGAITREEALELLQELMLKCNEITYAPFDLDSHVTGITLGGQTEYGEDATNEMTHLFLEALERLRMPKPQVSLRVHRGTPRELLRRAIEVMRVSGGRPQLNSDEAILPSLLRWGIPLKEARNYSVDGCQHFTTYGRKDHSGWLNLVKVLELALNDGVDRYTGRRIGAPTGDPRTFSTFEELLGAFRRQLEHCVKLMVEESELMDAAIRGEMCLPYASLHVEGCLERGKEVLEGGGRYNWTGIHGVGLANVANSLAALRKLVFEEKRISMGELLEALARDFEGHEELRRELEGAPKWGNDDDYVDSLAVWVANLFFDEVDRHVCRRDPEHPGPFTPGLHSLIFNVNLGLATAATPDGRGGGDLLSDGISPFPGTHRGGPTTVFTSAAKLDHARSYTASLALTIQGPVEALTDLFRTYLIDLGGLHLHVNLLSPEVLLEAKKHPERYPDLLVRVAGFSARFVELPEVLQDLVIRRVSLAL
jgi:formate C-acetyltransferase